MRTPTLSLLLLSALSLTSPTLAIGFNGKVVAIDHLAARSPSSNNERALPVEEAQPSKMIKFRKRKPVADPDSSADLDYVKNRKRSLASDGEGEQKVLKLGRREGGKQRMDARDHGLPPRAAAHHEMAERMMKRSKTLKLAPVLAPVLNTVNKVVLGNTIPAANAIVGTAEGTVFEDLGTTEHLLTHILTRSNKKSSNDESTATLKELLKSVNKALADTTSGVNALLKNVEKTGSSDLLDVESLLTGLTKRSQSSNRKTTLNQLLTSLNKILGTTVVGANSIVSTTEKTASLDLLDVEKLLTSIKRRSPKLTLGTLLAHVNAVLADTTKGVNSLLTTVEKTGAKDVGDVEGLILHLMRRADEDPLTLDELLAKLKERGLSVEQAQADELTNEKRALAEEEDEEDAALEKRTYTKSELLKAVNQILDHTTTGANRIVGTTEITVGKDVLTVEDLLKSL